MPIPNLRSVHAIGLISLALFLTAPTAGAVDCSAVLSDKPAEDSKVLELNQEFLFRDTGRVVAGGKYPLVFQGRSVTDVEGLVEKGKTFQSLKALMLELNPKLGSIYHPFYLKTRFHVLGSNSFRRQPLKKLMVEDYKNGKNWDSLSFVPTDETALAARSPQIKKVAKRLRQLRKQLEFKSIPPHLVRSSWDEVYSYYSDRYRDVHDEIASLLIENVETEEEGRVNFYLSRLLKNLGRNLEKKIQYKDNLKSLNFQDLDISDYRVISDLRSWPRSSVSELAVALLVPNLLGVGLNMNKAASEKFLPLTAEVMEELRAEGLDRLELDILTRDRIYEIKSSSSADFAPSTAGHHSRSSAPAAPTSVHEAESQIIEGRVARQGNRQAHLVEILKKHGVVSNDFKVITIFVDGFLQENDHMKDPQTTLGLIDGI